VQLLRVAAAVVAVLFAVCFLTVVAGVAYLGVRSHQAVTLPAPTGPYPVGRTIYDWTDASRLDPFGPPGTQRELSVWIWYPAVATAGTMAPYLPSTWERDLPLSPLGSLVETAPSLIRAHSVEDAPVLGGPPLPVLIFEPGLGLAAYNYTSIIEDLASHGYVVAAINPTYSTAVVLGGRVIPSTEQADDDANPARLQPVWVADIEFVAARIRALDGAGSGPFARRLATTRMGFLGHSLGGAAVAAACRVDRHCVGAVDMDGYLWDQTMRGIGRPFLFIGSQDGLEGPMKAQLRGALSDVPQGEGYVLTVKGTEHFNFSDRALYFFAPLRPLGLTGPIDGARGIAITRAYLLAFFGRYLGGRSASLLAGPSPAYPEVSFHDL
jgi:predicted dienelactone hydrolase